MPRCGQQIEESGDLIEIRYRDAFGRPHVDHFKQSCEIGRADECDLRIPSHRVSRRHLRVLNRDGHWFAQDLSSRNGTWVNGVAIGRVELTDRTHIRLGFGGPVIWATPWKSNTPIHLGNNPELRSESYSVQDIRQRRGHSWRKGVRGSRRHVWWTLPIGCLLISVAGFFAVSIFQYLSMMFDIELTQDDLAHRFYVAKIRELEYLTILDSDETTPDDLARNARIHDELARFERARRDYDRFLENDKLRSTEMIHPRQRLVRDVALAFGDYPHAIPARFYEEIGIHIKDWQETDNLRQSIIRLDESMALPVIYGRFRDVGLAPHFLYLGLIESRFCSDLVDYDPIRGYTRGLWQLTDNRATRIGLRLGPKSKTEILDPDDERHDISISTAAVAGMLREIYVNDAQGSGLLTLALYLADDPRLVALVRSYPSKPDARNFWMLYRQQRISKAVEEQIGSLFAAAVIGEYPRLFGFDFDNPLRGVGSEPRKRPNKESIMLARSAGAVRWPGCCAQEVPAHRRP